MSYLISLFEHHSYLILFIGIFLELLAIPISGEFLMSYAGYFVYQGKMNYILALLTVFVSGGAGITVTYWIGNAGGYKLIEKYGRYVHLGPERYKKTADWMERSGSKLLIFAYFIPGIRHFTGYISGISMMPFRKFILPAYTGAFLWAFTFITLGKILGPKWESLHQAASKYFIILIIVLAVLIVGYFLYRIYKNQIKQFFILFIQRLLNRLKTLRATELFLIFLTLVLIGMVTLMLGMAQDYLYGEFNQFNEIAEFIIKSAIYMGWMRVFLVFQSPIALCSIGAITMIRIWSRNRNRALEYLLLGVSIVGAKPFHEMIIKAFSYLQSIGFVRGIHSTNFPDIHFMMMIIIYGTCLFLLVRHSEKNYFPIYGPIIGLVLLAGIAVVKIESAVVLPSDIAGGYVYGGVWILFNILLFEMLRIVLERYREE